MNRYQATSQQRQRLWAQFMPKSKGGILDVHDVGVLQAIAYFQGAKKPPVAGLDHLRIQTDPLQRIGKAGGVIADAASTRRTGTGNQRYLHETIPFQYKSKRLSMPSYD